MGYKRLYIWVEGQDDQRFFKQIIEPKLRDKYDRIETICYRELKKEKLESFLKSIKAMGADYIYVTDIDQVPCVTAKKDGTQHRLRNIDKEKIIVVIKEIESWYLAGLGNAQAEKFKISAFTETDDITKEQFKNLIPKTFNSRIDFLLEILKSFSIEAAKQKNKSFKYLVEKYVK